MALAKAQPVLAGTDTAADTAVAALAVVAAAAVGTGPSVDRLVGSVELVNIDHLGSWGHSLDCTLGCTLSCTLSFVIRSPFFRYF